MVPAKTKTVFVPPGTLEPHGVAPNGTDILALLTIARDIAPRENAMVVPVIAYGFTGILNGYPGSFTVPEESFRNYVRTVLVGLAKTISKTLSWQTGMAAAKQLS